MLTKHTQVEEIDTHVLDIRKISSRYDLITKADEISY